MASLSLLGVRAVSGHHGIGLGSSRQLILNIAGLRNSESHLSVGLLAGNVECGRQLGRGEPWMTYIGLRAAGVSDKLWDAHTWGCCCSCRKSSGQAVSLSTPGDGDFLSDNDPRHLFPTCRDAGVTRTYHVTSMHSHFWGGFKLLTP